MTVAWEGVAGNGEGIWDSEKLKRRMKMWKHDNRIVSKHRGMCLDIQKMKG